MDARRPIIVSGANDAYMDFLDDMLASIQDRLHEYDLGILDLGLSEESKDRIRAHKEGAKIVDPGWRHQPGDMSKQPLHKKVFLAKPFLPEIFPGHSGYMWIDADIWLLDSSAIEHYIKASEQSRDGGSITYECHPHYKDVKYKPRFRVVKKFNILPVAIRVVSRTVYRLTHEMFGDEIARRWACSPTINSGFFFIQADSPAWSAWQHYTHKANFKTLMKRNYFSDQTCLNVAMRENNLSFNTLPPTYNWVIGLGLPLYDEDADLLLDPCGPHDKLYTIHLTNKIGSQIFKLRTTNGGHINTSLKRPAFLQTISDKSSMPS